MEIDLPQSGGSCAEVEGELYMPRREVERDEVPGCIAMVAVVEYNTVRGGRFQCDSQFQPGQRRVRQSGVAQVRGAVERRHLQTRNQFDKIIAWNCWSGKDKIVWYWWVFR